MGDGADQSMGEGGTDETPHPNEQQQTLVDSTEGLHLVDAGAGTGKTFTLARRYANIVDQEATEPEDVLLVTFTRNAAAEMRDRVVAHCDYGAAELADAPIQTFHSLCLDILQDHGFDAPALLGIDDSITSSTRVVEDDTVERALFEEFYRQFTDRHPEHTDLVRVVDDPDELRDLITQLAAKGVFPTADGWYRDGGRHLDGDFAAFQQQFERLNRPRNDGSKQSRLRAKLYRYGNDKLYLPDAPAKGEIRGDGKQVPSGVARQAFEEDREALTAFVHDVYFEYLRFALSRNYLTFGFLQLFAFVLLVEDDDLRKSLSYEYAMVDEFQDSSEIQFKLTLLLAGTDNLCVVGDWKQSIYSFQYAAVENIIEFEERLDAFAAELNEDVGDGERDRVAFDVGADVSGESDGAAGSDENDETTASVETVELTRNYRSTQSILEFSEHGLVVPAANHDDVDEAAVRDRVVSLSADTDRDHSRIEARQSDDEPEAILATIQDIVGSDDYRVESDDGDLRPPRFEDVAVLTRTRDFGRELQDVADDHGLPMAYEGGIELFRTDHAKLLLAWLRIVESDADRGWAPVLERAGYAVEEIRHCLDTGDYPEEMVAFRERLAATETLGGVVRQVLDRYDLWGPRGNVLLSTVQSVHDATTMTRGDLIRFVERGVETGSTHEVTESAGENSVTVRTIHATKGLEHPIVVLANMNEGRFPPSGGGSPTISYDDALGLRQREEYGEAHGDPYVYDSWRWDVLRHCRPSNYDEERRLLYVAITRAESHVVFTAGEEPNRFVEELPVEVQSVEPEVEAFDVEVPERDVLTVEVPAPEGSRGVSPHDLMDEGVYEAVEGGRGTEFGTAVHDFAEAYARRANGEAGDGEDGDGGPEPDNDDERHVAAFLDGLEGDLEVEVPAYLPLAVGAGEDGGDAGGGSDASPRESDRVTVSGVVDLVHVTDDAVEVLDYKTDRGRHAEPEYRKQLSVYYHVVSALYPERDVTASILYTADGEQVAVEVLSVDELCRLVAS